MHISAPQFLFASHFGAVSVTVILIFRLKITTWILGFLKPIILFSQLKWKFFPAGVDIFKRITIYL